MRRVIFAVLALICATPAAAQDYPNRPVRIIVPTPAGGPVDVMARLLANALPETLKQRVFIENKPGAGNTLGSRLAAAADPDGYTLMVSAASGLIMSPMIHKNAGYDFDSFTPVMLIAEAPQVLVINPALPFKSVAELIAYAKANPGKLNYSTGGAGTLPHLAAELFKKLAGVDIVHVPYKGGGPALTAVMAGEAQLTFDTLGTSLQLIRDGKLRVLAIGAAARVPDLPDVPTMAELGMPELTAGAWTALMAPGARRPRLSPSSTPPPTPRSSRSACARRSPNSARSRAAARRTISPPISRANSAKWAPFVEALNLKVD